MERANIANIKGPVIAPAVSLRCKISQTTTGCIKELEAKMTLFSDGGRDNYSSNLGVVNSKRADESGGSPADDIALSLSGQWSHLSEQIVVTPGCCTSRKIERNPLWWKCQSLINSNLCPSHFHYCNLNSHYWLIKVLNIFLPGLHNAMSDLMWCNPIQQPWNKYVVKLITWNYCWHYWRDVCSASW